jgi:spermidine/putrescine transport system ATP-binding protein
MAAAGTAVEIEALTKTFGQGAASVLALDDIWLRIRENEFFTLLGPSGCGKTTLLRLIAGFEHPDGGRILLDGADIAPLPPYQRPINTVFQSYALFPHMTVAGNIGFGLEMQGRPGAEVRERTEAMLRLVRMEALKNRRTGEISGGQQQRVALARALAPQPKVLLLDEPLSALDLKLRKEMQIELKRQQHETGITFIFVTHDQEEALTMSDRIAVMSNGLIQQVGSPHEIYERPLNRFVADFIGDTNFVEAVIEETSDGAALCRLAGGTAVNTALVGARNPGDRVTLALRPEKIAIFGPGNAALPATVHNAVYMGTDTALSLRLADGTSLAVRLQNTGEGGAPFKSGDAVSLAIAEGCARMLQD